MSDSEKPSFPIKDLVTAGPMAPVVLVRHIVETQGPALMANARSHRAADDFAVEEYVDRLIASQRRLARAQGAGGGAVVAAAQIPAALAGPGAALAASVTMILADLTALAWIQVRLALMIAAAYGHDLDDADERAREVLLLSGPDLVAGEGGGRVAGAGGARIGKRLLERYLRGPALQAVKSMFRLVGIKFSRAALVRGLPLVNIPAGMVVSDITTLRAASKARDYYSTLPVARPT